MGYYEVMRGLENIFNMRLEMVKLAQEKGICETSRLYHTTRKTVRKWVNRYRQEGLQGLTNRKRVPKHIPHKTPKEIENRVIELRKTHPAWGPERLKMHYELPISTKAIARILRQAGLVRKKKKKWKKQRDLPQEKRKLRPLQMIEIDTKDLSDIENYWPQMYRLKLPCYQCTARDVRTGGQWISYAESKETTNAAIFARYVLWQLKHYGVDLSEVIIQTDNGSEFIGGVRKRKGQSAFIKVLMDAGVKQARIPPRACSWQSDGEARHKMIEDEFYDIEDYTGVDQFKAKAYAYQLYFNFKRKHRYKERKAPIEILKEAGSSISPQVFNLPPVILDNFLYELIEDGYHAQTRDRTFFT